MPQHQRVQGDAVESPAPKGGNSETSTSKFVRFTAHNGVRVIEAKDWKAVGVEDQGKAVWDKKNAWQLPSSEFNEKALNYLLNVDGEFKEVELKSE